MKTTLFTTLLLFFLYPIQEETKITGIWKLAENNTEVDITEDGGLYQGTVVKSEATKGIGKVILQDFKKEGEVWKGKFYAVKRDRLVDATLEPNGQNKLSLQIKAGRMSRTLELTRDND